MTWMPASSRATASSATVEEEEAAGWAQCKTGDTDGGDNQTGTGSSDRRGFKDFFDGLRKDFKNDAEIARRG